MTSAIKITPGDITEEVLSLNPVRTMTSEYSKCELTSSARRTLGRGLLTSSNYGNTHFRGLTFGTKREIVLRDKKVLSAWDKRSVMQLVWPIPMAYNPDPPHR